MPMNNWQHLVFRVHLVLSSGSLHDKGCGRADMSFSGMSFLLPPFSSPKEGERGGENSNIELIELQMVPLTSRTIRNCTMNNSVFCHFRGFPFCLYNSGPFLPPPFLLRRNPGWRGNLQGLPACLTCRWHFPGVCRKPPAGGVLTVHMWDLHGIHILDILTYT